MFCFWPALALVASVALASCGGGSSAAAQEASQRPELADAANQAWPINSRITPLVIVNTGGAPRNTANGCQVLPGLPTGLVIEVSADGRSCQISGTPTEVSAGRPYTVTANNARGSETAMVRVEVFDPAVQACSAQTLLSLRSRIYQIHFDSAWNEANNGVAPPLGAGYSMLVGVNHNQFYSMWEPGEVASVGVEDVAELGASLQLLGQITLARAAGNVDSRNIVGPENAVEGMERAVVTASCDFPLVSLVAKVLPSPDWFVGIHDVSLVDAQGGWNESVEVPLYVYDAGTRSGAVFNDRGSDLAQKQPIARLRGSAEIGLLAGRDRVGTMRLEAVPLPPQLEDVVGVREFKVAEPIEPIVFTNVGGVSLYADDFELPGCSMTPSLVRGLRVRQNDEGTTCLLEGIPGAPFPVSTYTMRAENPGGTGQGTVRFSVTGDPLNPETGCHQPRMSLETSVVYTAEFEAEWTVANNGGTLPQNARFSPLIGASHDSDYAMWTPGAESSDAFEEVAEAGGVDMLMGEFARAKTDGNVAGVISGPANGATGTVTTDFTATCEDNLVSLATMLMPSPDWFVGVNAVPLVDVIRRWRPSVEMPLYVYDAGTDAGTGFESRDRNLAQRRPIARLQGDASIGFQAGMQRVGTMRIRRAAPALAASQSHSFDRGVIGSWTLANNSGNGLFADDAATPGCTVSPVLPAGLVITRSDDGFSCVITGMPTAAVGSASYTVTATNPAGSSVATVEISLAEPATACSAAAAANEASVDYLVNFTTTWSQANNGVALPGGAHFTTLAGATHSANYQMWGNGVLATRGLESLAETGSTSALRGELMQRISAGEAGALVSVNGISGGAGSSTGRLTATCAHPLVSLASMLAPSPDWFVGVHDLSMLDSNGEWRSSTEVALYVYDAGTEDGRRFSLANPDANPKLPIQRLIGGPTIGFQAGMERIGTMSFMRATPARPALAAGQSYAFERGVMGSWEIANDGGGGLFADGASTPGCAVSPALPTGLAIARSGDGGSCVVSGTPMAAGGPSTYTISATSATGSSMATVEITVAEPPPSTACSATAAANESSVDYRIEFITTWSRANNGVALPGGAHFTTLAGATHNAGYRMWHNGAIASDGLESLAETGGTGGLSAEVRQRITAGDAGSPVSVRGISGGSGSSTGRLTATCDHHLVSLASMLAPSPDWFVGVHDLSLIGGDGAWLDSVEEPLYVYDAGTEDGRRFSLSNPNTRPKIPIRRLAGDSTIGFQAGMDRIGTMRFMRATPARPALAAGQSYAFERGVMGSWTIANDGGGGLFADGASTPGCAVSPALPTGLAIARSGDGGSCVVSGTPMAVGGPSTYTISATSATGSSMATVEITVAEPSPSTACSATAAANESSVDYQIEFTTTWSQANNGVRLPSSAHFTSLTGATHNADYRMWYNGAIASNGLESLAEVGGTGTVSAEIRQQITAGDAGSLVSIRGVSGGSGTSTGRLTATCDHHLVSLASMLAPSPDWFVGVHDLSLIGSDGAWLDSVEEPLYVYDAGTESGRRFSLSNPNTRPKIPIRRLVGDSTIGFQAGMERIGTMRFTRATPARPALAAGQSYAFERGVMGSWEIANDGGGGLFADGASTPGCAVSPALPTGLAIARSADGGSCVVSGTPMAAGGPSTYTISATSATGSSMATVEITVAEPPPSTACSAAAAANEASVDYQIEFITTWSQANNGVRLPGGAHFTTLAGATHNAGYRMWHNGAIASDGLESLAETGGTGGLSAEVRQRITAGDAGSPVSIRGISGGSGSSAGRLTATCDHHLVSLASMLAPSPDWFVGVHDLSLIGGDGAWLGSVEEPLYVYDAGTEDGRRFSLSNPNTRPKIPIRRLAGDSAIGFQAGMDRIGTMRFRLLPARPALAAGQSYAFERGVMGSWEIANDGGGGLFADGASTPGCAVSPALPTGLAIARSADGGSCVVSGTPMAAGGPSTYAISATSAMGSSMATVEITVAEPPPSTACSAAAAANESSVDYQIEFITTWSRANNGVRLPSSAHFTSLTGATHNADYRVWHNGAIASNGLESLAEIGGTGGLSAEIRQRITAGDAGSLVSIRGVSGGSGTSAGRLTATCDHHLVSLASMLAPSPDWFVGVHDLSLIGGDGAWLDSVEEPLYVYDAGTEDGRRFSLSNPNTRPKIPIRRLVGDSTIGFQAGMERIGTMRFTRVPEVPALASVSGTQTYTRGQRIVPLDFTNDGGGSLFAIDAAMSGCVVDTPLPMGLALALGSGGNSCQITGVPGAVMAVATYTVTARNLGGASAGATVMIEVVEPAPTEPAFADPGALTYMEGMDFEEMLENTVSEVPVTGCAKADTLPLGMEVALLPSPGDGCLLSGRPREASARAVYGVTVSYMGGTVTLNLDIAVNPVAPSLVAAQSYVFDRGVMGSWTLTNGGGGVLNADTDSTPGCAVSPALPNGLVIGRSDDGDSCVISGTPMTAAGPSTYTITASNVTGSSMATVEITVTEPPPSTACSATAAADEPSVDYQIEFTTTWSQANNGVMPPSGAHFTQLAGATHNADYRMWQPGGIATNGLESLAETGGTGTLRSEITPRIGAGEAGAVVAVDGIGVSAGTSTGRLTATCDHPLVSLASMLAPSPDWFVGVHGSSMLGGDGEWLDSVEVTLYVYDAGTEEGRRFSLSNPNTRPKIPIRRLVGDSTIGFQAGMDRIGTMRFTRVPDAPALASVSGTQTYTRGQRIDPLAFTNDGGGSLFAIDAAMPGCAVDTMLPAGLALGLSEDGDSCQITGVPGAAAAAATYTVTARNLGGASAGATVVIEVVEPLGLPNLRSAMDASYLLGDAVSIAFVNDGGGQLFADDATPKGCAVDTSLPTGLELGRSEDGDSCQITGTAMQVSGSALYTITARNATGMATATVRILVQGAPALGNIAGTQMLRVGVENAPVLFANSGGGEILADSASPDPGCVATNLPAGLRVERSPDEGSCQIVGRAMTVNTTPVTVSVTARNRVGVSAAAASVDIAITALDRPLFASSNSGQESIDIAGFEFCCGKYDTYREHGFAEATGDLIRLDGGAFLDGTLSGIVGERAFASYGDGSPDETTNVAQLGDSATGTITSPAFTVQAPYINFLVGGGSNAYGTLRATAVVLLVDGAVVRASSGSGTRDVLAAASWDVSAYLGMSASVRFIDMHDGTGGGLAHLVADNFRAADLAAVETPQSSLPVPSLRLFASSNSGQENTDIASFEFCCGKYDTYREHGFAAATGDFLRLDGGAFLAGTLSGIVGDRAFASYGDGSPDETTAPAQIGDSATGTLDSPAFTVVAPYINFLVGGSSAPYGSNHATAVVLLVDGNVVRASSGNGMRDSLSAASWDVSAYMGMSASVRFIDMHDGGGGTGLEPPHLVADHFRASTVPTAMMAQSEVPSPYTGGHPLFASAESGQDNLYIAGFEFCCGKYDTYRENGFAAATGDFLQLDGGFWASGIAGSVGQRAFSSYGDGSPDEATNAAQLGNAATGTLDSPAFTISADYINFLIGGGSRVYGATDATAVALLIDGQVVRASSGNDTTNTLAAASWDVSDYDSRTATVRFIDSNDASGSGSALPYLLADEFRSASTAAVTIESTAPVLTVDSVVPAAESVAFDLESSEPALVSYLLLPSAMALSNPDADDVLGHANVVVFDSPVGIDGATTAAMIDSLTASTAYTLYIVAVDYAGNPSALSTQMFTTTASTGG